MKWFKKIWDDFIWLPFEMKLLFVGMVACIIYIGINHLNHNKKKTITVTDIENGIQKIDSITTDSARWLNERARANGIQRKRL